MHNSLRVSSKSLSLISDAYAEDKQFIEAFGGSPRSNSKFMNYLVLSYLTSGHEFLFTTSSRGEVSAALSIAPLATQSRHMSNAGAIASLRLIFAKIRCFGRLDENFHLNMNEYTDRVSKLIISKDFLRVSMIAVGKHFRRQGIATALLEEASKRVASEGLRGLEVVTYHPVNVAIYESMGFSKIYEFHEDNVPVYLLRNRV